MYFSWGSTFLSDAQIGVILFALPVYHLITNCEVCNCLLAFNNLVVTFAVKALGGQLVTIDELMKNSDFIIIAMALNDETNGIINRERIASMKSNAILVNIGRGSKFILHKYVYLHTYHIFGQIFPKSQLKLINLIKQKYIGNLVVTQTIF